MSDREKAIFVNGVMLATVHFEQDSGLAERVAKALGVSLRPNTDVADEICQALDLGGFRGPAATRRARQ